MSDRNLPRTAVLYALGAAGAWSTSAAFGGFIGERIPPVAIVFYIQLIAWITLGAHLLANGSLATLTQRVRALVRTSVGLRRPVRPLVGIAAFAVGVTAYQLCFYTAMADEGRLYANIINYIWPVLLIFTNYYVFGNEARPPSPTTLVVMAIGLFGVWSIILATGVELTNDVALLSGAAAAILAALYMGQSAILTIAHNFNASEVWWLGLSLSLPLQLVVFVVSPLELMVPASISDFGVLVWLGVFTVALAQTWWTKALARRESDLIYVIIYLTPVLSSILQLLFFGENPPIAFYLGMTLVVVSILLSMKVFQSLSAEVVAVAIFMYMAFFAFFSTTLVPLNLPDLSIEIPTELFAVLAAFLLARQWERFRTESVALTSFAGSISDLHNYLRRPTGATDPNIKERLRGELGDVYQAVIDFDQAGGLVKSLTPHRNLIKALDKYASTCRRLRNDDELEQYIVRSRTYVIQWVSQRSQKTPFGDVLALVILAVGISAGFWENLTGSMYEQLAAITMVSVFSYLIARIVAHDYEPTMKNVIDALRVQQEGEVFDLPVYLGNMDRLAVFPRGLLIDRMVNYCLAWSRPGPEFGGDPNARLYKYQFFKRVAVGILVVAPVLVALLLVVQKTQP